MSQCQYLEAGRISKASAGICGLECGQSTNNSHKQISMRTNYVLIDFENVQPDSMELLAGEQFKVLVFVGANQTKIPFDIVSSLQKLGNQAEYIKICGNGINALDFHIAYYVGKLSADDCPAFFHIVSKDKGFDPLIQYLKSQKIFAGRVTSIKDIPLIKATKCNTPQEKADVTLARLQQLKLSKPRTVKTLSNMIAALFHKQLSDFEVVDIVQSLVKKGYVKITDDKVVYSLPSEG